MVYVLLISLLVYVGIGVAIAIDEHEQGERWVQRMRSMPRKARWDSWWVKHSGYVTALVLLLVLIPVPRVQAAGCDVTVRAPANLNQRLKQIGPNKVVCLRGAFHLPSSLVPLRGQTLVGPAHLRGHTNQDGMRLNRIPNVTLRRLEISGFGGRGVTCGPHTRVLGSFLHHNRQNAIGCNAHHAPWRIVIRNNRIVRNGAAALEGHSSAGIKLMELARPASSTTAGAKVTNNFIAHNFGNGLWFDIAASGGLARNNIVRDNTRHGIRCEICGGPFLFANNTITGNGYSGIDITSTGRARLVDNRIAGNVRVGIDIIEVGRRSINHYPHLTQPSKGFYFDRIVLRGRRFVSGEIRGCAHPKVRCS